jgi:hypothetical protein
MAIEIPNGSLTRWAVGLVLLFVAGTSGYFLKATVQKVWENEAKILILDRGLSAIQAQQDRIQLQQDRMELKMDRLIDLQMRNK